MYSKTDITSHCHLEDFWINGHHTLHWIDVSTGNDLIDANFTSRSIGKLGSDKAINKSVLNGFSTQEHFEAAFQIKQLYEMSDFIGRFLDDRNDPNVIAMFRFQIPIILSSGNKAFAYISTKEVKIHGNRTYTIELLKNPYPKK